MPADTLSPAAPTPPPLMPEERIVLDRCEGVIERGLTTFFEVGEALNTIKQDGLYRTAHATFDEYCRERWGIGKAWANRTIQGAKVREQLASDPGRDVLPDRHAQVRPLEPLTRVEREDAWDRAVAASGGGQPNWTQVLEAVSAVRSLSEPPTATLTNEAFAEIVASPGWRDGQVISLPPSDVHSLASVGLGWIEQLEEALRSIQDGGLVYGVSGTRCVSGCEPRATPNGAWRHDDECLLAKTLAVIREMEALP